MFILTQYLHLLYTAVSKDGSLHKQTKSSFKLTSVIISHRCIYGCFKMVTAWVMQVQSIQ